MHTAAAPINECIFARELVAVAFALLGNLDTPVLSFRAHKKKRQKESPPVVAEAGSKKQGASPRLEILNTGL